MPIAPWASLRGGETDCAFDAAPLDQSMNSNLRAILILASLAVAVLPACTAIKRGTDPADGDLYRQLAASVPLGDPADAFSDEIMLDEAPPLTIRSDAPIEYWDVTLAEAIEMGLSRSSILNDLGGTLLRTPIGYVSTIYDPAVADTDPRFGPEAVLSEFDATFSTRANFQNLDRALNNAIVGLGTTTLNGDNAAFQTRLSKRAATGGQFALTKNTDYETNNALGNTFPSAWSTNIEAEIRQPLLQGAGVAFNRIAGPNAVPGINNGVLIARVNTDVRVTDFEAGVRDFVANVENAYWDLYFAYRDLAAKIVARDAALETWRGIRARYESAELAEHHEARAREQYFLFAEAVENALSGRLLGGTRTDNGSSGGSVRAIGGVQTAERRLRLLMGLPVSDGRLIRPADEPTKAAVLFDWHEVTREALVRRVELQRQKLEIKRRQMDLFASRNFLLPRLDAFGRYRWRGFGDDLLDPDRSGKRRFDNAYMDLTSGDFQEWELGIELNVPIGYRRAHAAVTHAQLQLARARAILTEQERAVVHNLANAVADADRTYAVARTSFNRWAAARQEVEVTQARYDENLETSVDLLLEAQRRRADAESRHFETLIEHAVAIRNVHYEKGSLLEYHEIHLTESSQLPHHESLPNGPDARHLNYIMQGSPPASIRVRHQSATGDNHFAPR